MRRHLGPSSSSPSSFEDVGLPHQPQHTPRPHTNHPDFDRLTSREYDPLADVSDLVDQSLPDENDWGGEDDWSSDGDEESTPPWITYTKETQSQIIGWKPELWRIVEQNELDNVASILTPYPEELTLNDDDSGLRPKQHFSVAATAIRFLERLSPKQRLNVRNIIIEEDYPGVGLPPTHARGLIPFCIENPKLRIERRVNIWSTVFIPNSADLNRYVRGKVGAAAEWIAEAKFLPLMGMPAASFSLVLHGPSREASQQLCDAMFRAAIWEHGAMELCRRRGERLSFWMDGVAEDFGDTMKAMVRGEILARFEADMGEVWDMDQLLRKHEGDWPDHISRVFNLHNFKVPNGGWDAARAEYYIEAI